MASSDKGTKSAKAFEEWKKTYNVVEESSTSASGNKTEKQNTGSASRTRSSNNGTKSAKAFENWKNKYNVVEGNAQSKPSGMAYESAVKYLRDNNVPGASAAGIMTEREWSRRKGASGGTYQDYLAEVIPRKIYLEPAKNSNKKTITYTSEMPEEDRKKRIAEIDREMQDAYTRIDAIQKGITYNSGRNYFDAGFLEDEKKRLAGEIATLSNEKKNLERVGIFSPMEVLDWEIQDAERNLASNGVTIVAGEAAGRKLASKLLEPGAAAAYAEGMAKRMQMERDLDTLKGKRSFWEYATESDAKSFDDDFWGQFGANYGQTDLSIKASKADGRYVKNPTKENREIAEGWNVLLREHQTKHKEALDDEGAKFTLLSKDLAGYLPQVVDRLPAEAVGAVVGGLLGSLKGATKAGISIGRGIATGVYTFEQLQGSAYRAMIEAGVDDETARKNAADEAWISSLLEGVDSIIETWSLGSLTAAESVAKVGGKAISKKAAEYVTKRTAKQAAKSVGKPVSKKVASMFGGWLFNDFQEYGEEFSQSMVTRGNINRSKRGETGLFNLIGSTFKTFADAITGKDPEALAEAHEAGVVGFRTGMIVGGSTIATNAAITYAADTADLAMTGRESREYAQYHIEEGLRHGENTTAHKIAQKLSGQEYVSDVELGRQVLANTLAEGERMIADFKDDKDILNAMVAEGKDIGGVAAKVAKKVEQKVKSGKEVSVGDVESLFVVNNVYAMAEMAEEAAPTRVDKVKEFTGYGEHGTKAFMSQVELDGGKHAAEELKRGFDDYYEAGKVDLPEHLVPFSTPAQKLAYNAGQMDRIADLSRDVENSKYAKVSVDSGLKWTAAAKGVSRANIEAMDAFGKALRNSVMYRDTVAAGGKADGANGVTLPDGTIVISANTDPGKQFGYFMHEAGHRMMQLAPKETREFVNAVVTRYSNWFNNSGSTPVAQMRNFSAASNVPISVDVAMEEIGMDEVMEMFGQNRDRAVAILHDVQAEIEAEAKREGKTEAEAKTQAENVIQRFIEAIRSVIQSLKEYLAKNKGTMSKSTRAEFETAIKDLTETERLFKDALKASVKNAQELAAKKTENSTNTLEKSGGKKYNESTRYSPKALRGRSVEIETMENNRFERLRQFHGNLPSEWYAFSGNYFYIYSNQSHTEYTILSKVSITNTNRQHINNFVEAIEDGINGSTEILNYWVKNFRRGKGRYTWNYVGTSDVGPTKRHDGLDVSASKSDNSGNIGGSRENSQSKVNYSIKDSKGSEQQIAKRHNESIRYSQKSGTHQYTEQEYRDYGWARENEILTAGQNEDYRSKFAMAKSGQATFPKTKSGEYIIAVSDIYDSTFEGINNVLVFAKGTIAKPVITSVIEIFEYDETSLDKVRRNIYELERRGIQQETSGIVRRHYAFDFAYEYNGGNIKSGRYNNDDRFGRRDSAETSAAQEGSTNRYSVKKPSYEGKSMTKDGEIYSYDFLTSLPDMQIVAMPSLSDVKEGNRVDRTKAINSGLENAREEGRLISDTVSAVKNIYTGREIQISKSGLGHSLDGENISRLRTNARISAIAGTVVKNAVPINALKNKNPQADGTYAMAAALKSGEMTVVAIVTVGQHGNVVGIDCLDIVHSINGRLDTKKGGNRSATRASGFSPATATSTISIADFLEIVNSTHQSILSKDVLKHFGEERNPAGYYSDRVLYSLKGQEAIMQEYRGLVEKHGAMRPGENPSRDVQVPKKTADGKKVSQTVRTILEAEVTPDEALPSIEDMVVKGDFSYDVYTDKKAVHDAEAYLKEHGWEDSMREWFDSVNRGEVSKQTTSMGWALYNNAVHTAKTTKSQSEKDSSMRVAMDVLNAMVKHQRSAAQALQATRILKKLSPETQLYGISKSVQALQKELTDKYGDKAPNLKIEEALAKQFLEAETQEERDAAEREIYKDIGRQMPSRFIDKWNAWRYLAMLSNIRTHGRNIVGNAGFAPVVLAKDVLATGIEAAVHRISGGKTSRSKAVITGRKADRALLKAAWDDYANVADIVSNGGKYNDSANANKFIEEGRVIFKFKTLDRGRKWNRALLEAEDVWFSKPHYAYALAQYCKANKITAEQIAKGKAIQPARVYAIKEAQKATYKDTNAFSQMVSGWGRRDNASDNAIKKGLNTVITGVLPFRKTPANILVRGVEYSPVGLLKGLTYDLAQVSKGEMPAAEAIDHISAGFTGTTLLALGVLLAAQGIVRGHGGDDDDKKEFEELMGHQAYALELPNGESVTLDWLAPEALPFFVGVNIWEATKGSDDKVNLSNILSAVSNISEPMLEMSCLQSLNDLFESVGYASSNDMSGLLSVVSSGVTSYLIQLIPTLLGQAERTGETERMTTYTEKNNFLTGDVQYTLGKASAKIPFWDYNQIPYIDAWGRKEASGTALERGLNNFLNPAYTSKIEASDMEKELLRLYEATGEGGVFPKRAEKYFTVDKVRKDLTAEEYVKYATLKGQNSYKLVTDLVRSPEYKELSDEEKVRAIEDAYDTANKKAKTAISNYKPKEFMQIPVETVKPEEIGLTEAAYIILKDKYGIGLTGDGIKEAYASGVEAETYLEFKENVKTFKKANDDTISKTEVAQIIREQDVTSEEAWALYFDQYKPDEEDDEHTGAELVYASGIDADTYFDFLDELAYADGPTKGGKYGTYTQDEAYAAIQNLTGLSKQDKRILWQSLNKSWKKNPF